MKTLDLTNKTIVVVYMLYFGDMISLSPFLAVLRRAARGSRIILVTDERCRDAVSASPDVDEVIAADRRHMSMGDTWKLGRKIGGEKPDLLLVLHGTARTDLLSLAMHARCWAGEAGTWLGRRLIDLPLLVERKDCHAAEKYVRVLGDLGVTDLCYDGMKVYAEEEWEAGARSFYERARIGAGEKIAAFSVGSSTKEKNWPASRYGKTADAMAERGFRPVFFGIKSELPLIDEALSVMKHRGEAVVAAGKLSMGEFIAAAGRASIAFTNDSGPMYVFDSRGVPTIAMFGPSNARLHHPMGRRSCALASTDMPMTQDHVAHTIRDGRYIPIEAIPLEEVLRAASWALGEREDEEYESHVHVVSQEKTR